MFFSIPPPAMKREIQNINLYLLSYIQVKLPIWGLNIILGHIQQFTSVPFT